MPLLLLFSLCFIIWSIYLILISFSCAFLLLYCSYVTFSPRSSLIILLLRPNTVFWFQIPETCCLFPVPLISFLQLNEPYLQRLSSHVLILKFIHNCQKQVAKIKLDPSTFCYVMFFWVTCSWLILSKLQPLGKLLLPCNLVSAYPWKCILLFWNACPL